MVWSFPTPNGVGGGKGIMFEKIRILGRISILIMYIVADIEMDSLIHLSISSSTDLDVC